MQFEILYYKYTSPFLQTLLLIYLRFICFLLQAFSFQHSKSAIQQQNIKQYCIKVTQKKYLFLNQYFKFQHNCQKSLKKHNPLKQPTSITISQIVLIFFNRHEWSVYLPQYQQIVFEQNRVKRIMALIIIYQYNKLQMPERRVWTAEQDRVLKHLIQQRGLTGWSQISRAMAQQFNIVGRNGKKCRERYLNHLDHNINNSEWTLEEEKILFSLHDEVGNKWALISSKIPGRTDNCVKNHFYSKLRKGLRTINKKIHKFMKKEYREIKTKTLYKIIEILQNRNKPAQQNLGDESFELCKKIKDQIWQYQYKVDHFDDVNQEIQFVRTVIQNITLFDKEIRKNPRKNTLKSSAKFSEQDSSIKPPSYIVSTKSFHDDSSQSFSNNSELFSSSSFDRTLHGSQQLLKSSIFRSQKIQSESENDSQQQSELNLHKSANINIINQSGKRMPQIKQESKQKQNSFSSQSQQQQVHNIQQSKQHQRHDEYGMLGQQSMQMMLCSPKGLTFQQKIQIHQQQNDMLFYGDMVMIQQTQKQQEVIKGLSKMSLSQIPTLARYKF